MEYLLVFLVMAQAGFAAAPGPGLFQTAPAGTVARAPASEEKPRFVVTPTKVVFGLRHKKKPLVRKLSIVEEGVSILTVAPLQPWLKTTAVRSKKPNVRFYDVTVDTSALPPGSLHDGVIRIGGSSGVLDVPVVVETESTR